MTCFPIPITGQLPWPHLHSRLEGLTVIVACAEMSFIYLFEIVYILYQIVRAEGGG